MQSLFDELSATYDLSRVNFFGQIARTLIEYARVRQGATVLDVGCGAGAALIPASEAVGATGHVVGIDFALGMVERARRTVSDQALENVQVLVGDAECPPTEQRSVDVIVSSLVLFFLPNIDDAFEAYARTLVAGGTLAFSTFAGDDDWTPLDKIVATFARPPSQALPDTWFKTPSAIQATLEAHRFHNVSIHDITHQVQFPDISTFHEWNWSTGWRAAWSAIPPEHRETALAAVNNHLRNLQAQRGSLRLDTAVRYTRAEAT